LILPRNSNPYAPWMRAMTSATQSAASVMRASELAVSAATVIGRRSWLGIEGAADPVNADYAELARLAPEKVEAFSRAGAAVAKQVWEMQRELGVLWLRQAEAGWLLAFHMWQFPLPHHATQLHADFVAGSVDRAASTADSLAGRATRLPDHAIAPIRRAATRNARRLSRARA
jgi:hypothetical protein